MSEEEKKAIEAIKSHYNDIIKEFEKKANGSASCYSNSDINVLLNLIEKQQKEIEEKTTMIFSEVEKNKILEKEIVQLNEDLLEHEQTSFDFRYMSIRLQEEKDLLTKMNKKLIDDGIPKLKIEEMIENREENIETILNSANYGDDYTIETIYDLNVEKNILKELLESE